MEKFELINEHKRKIFINNFIGGIAWAIGATVGFAIVVAILSPILKQINLIPFVGNFVANVMQFIVDKNPNLLAR
jgi:hypothetical protein